MNSMETVCQNTNTKLHNELVFYCIVYVSIFRSFSSTNILYSLFLSMQAAHTISITTNDIKVISIFEKIQYFVSLAIYFKKDPKSILQKPFTSRESLFEVSFCSIYICIFKMGPRIGPSGSSSFTYMLHFTNPSIGFSSILKATVYTKLAL